MDMFIKFNKFLVKMFLKDMFSNIDYYINIDI